MENLLNMEEASTFLGVKTSTLYDWVHRKKITVVKIGKLNKFNKSDLEDYVKINTQTKVGEISNNGKNTKAHFMSH